MEYLVNTVRICLNQMRSKVELGNRFTKSSDIIRGLRQGDGMSTILFNIVLRDHTKIFRKNFLGIQIKSDSITHVAHNDAVL